MSILNQLLSIRRYSFLLSQLVRRDFKLKYRGSALGVLWSLLNPLLNMLVLSIVFGQVFGAVDNYKMYLLSGITVFTFFSESTNTAINSIVSNFGLITKIYLPKFILPLSKVLSSCINFFITMVVFLILSSFYGIKPWGGYFFILYLFVCLFLFSCGISFILSATQVFFRDTQHIYNVLLTVWMYATPILYPIETIPQSLQPLFTMNPMYIFINFLRQITLCSSMPTIQQFIACGLCGLISFVVGASVFVKVQRKFIFYT